MSAQAPIRTTHALSRFTFVVALILVMVVGSNRVVLAQANNVDPEARRLFEQAIEALITNARTGDKDSERLIGVPPALIARFQRKRRTLDDYIAEFVERSFHGTSQPPSLLLADADSSRKLDGEDIVHLITRSAEMGFAPAQFLVPRVTRVPPALRSDRVAWLTTRLNWIRRAADQGYAPALLELGESYYFSNGKPDDVVNRDERKALSLIQRAAEKDYAEAQQFLGQILGKNSFFLDAETQMDRIEALKWFEIALVNGKDTAKLRDDVAFYMTKSEISESRQRARSWLSQREKSGPSNIRLSVRPVEVEDTESSAPIAIRESGCDWTGVEGHQVGLANDELSLMGEEELAAFRWNISTHAPLPLDGEWNINTRYYSVNYSRELLIPTWVQYRIEASDLRNAEIKTAYRTDPRLEATDVASCGDFHHPGFVPGLMAAASHTSRSETSSINAYVLTNAAPRACTLDRGFWRGLDQTVQHWAELEETIYVLTGAIFDHNGDGHRDQNNEIPRINAGKGRVAIPSHFYRIVWNFDKSKVVAIAVPNTDFEIKNNEFESTLDAARVPLEWIESRAGIELIASRSSRRSLRNNPPYQGMWKTVHPLWPIPEDIDIESGLADCTVR